VFPALKVIFIEWMKATFVVTEAKSYLHKADEINFKHFSSRKVFFIKKKQLHDFFAMRPIHRVQESTQ